MATSSVFDVQAEQLTLSIKEVCDLTGRSRSWVYKQMDPSTNPRPLPFLTLNENERSRMVLKSDLLAWLRNARSVEA